MLATKERNRGVTVGLTRVESMSCSFPVRDTKSKGFNVGVPFLRGITYKKYGSLLSWRKTQADWPLAQTQMKMRARTTCDGYTNEREGNERRDRHQGEGEKQSNEGETATERP